MNKSTLAAAIRRHWGTKAAPYPHESQRDATIREYMRCPNCGEEQHDLDYEGVQELIASMGSLAEFDAAFIAACADNKERLQRAWADPRNRVCIDDLPPDQQEQVRRALAESFLLNAPSPSRLLN